MIPLCQFHHCDREVREWLNFGIYFKCPCIVQIYAWFFMPCKNYHCDSHANHVIILSNAHLWHVLHCQLINLLNKQYIYQWFQMPWHSSDVTPMDLAYVGRMYSCLYHTSFTKILSRPIPFFWDCFIFKTVFPGIVITIAWIRQSWNPLVFLMGIPIRAI